MGLIKSDFYAEIDYMLETILVYYLLLKSRIFSYICDLSKRYAKIERSRSISGKTYVKITNVGKPNVGIFYVYRSRLFNSQNNNNLFVHISCFSSIAHKKTTKYVLTGIQSAGNLWRSSETIRQLSFDLHTVSSSSNSNDFYNDLYLTSPKDMDSAEYFRSWFAGVIDGDGNFDVRKDTSKNLVLKAIRIKLHVRDARILTRIQNHLHFGKIHKDQNKPYCLYIVSTKKEMELIVNLINGLIRVKVSSFKKACCCLNIPFQEPEYVRMPYDPYFSGLIDTEGSIVFNFSGNRIECNLELKYNQYSKKLNFNKVIPHYLPSVSLRHKKKQTPEKVFQSIAWKYQTVSGMIYLYDYFMTNRLYSDIKFYRISKIKRFLEIRHYRNEPKDSLEFKIYSDFLIDFIKHLNSMYYKVPFRKKIRREEIPFL